jgi:phospholipase/carboxylesterase
MTQQSTLHSPENRRILGAPLGVPLAEAGSVVLMLHGRGATAESILDLAQYFPIPRAAYIAPQATNGTWYPYSFLAPLEQNEPYLSSALHTLETLVSEILSYIPATNLYLLGFSQGACLALEFAARNARQYGGVFAFSGGFIGPEATQRSTETIPVPDAGFAGMPVFLGCSDRDAHVPKDRVIETAALFEQMGATVEMRLYPNMPHTIVQDEIEVVRGILTTRQ